MGKILPPPRRRVVYAFLCVCCCRYGDDWFEAREEDEILPQIVGGDYYRVDDPATGRERVPGCPHQITALDYVSGGLRARRGLAGPSQAPPRRGTSL